MKEGSVHPAKNDKVGFVRWCFCPGFNCATWARLDAGTLTNSADPDQAPQNAAFDQGPHCLRKLQEVKI